MTNDTSVTDLRIGIAAWGTFIFATCAYCLLHQAFVSAVTPDVGRTLTIALREWGAWALLAPFALRMFRRPCDWRGTLLRCVLLGVAAAGLPIAVDLITHDRTPIASLALFWPRNFAMAVALLCLARVFPGKASRPASAPEKPRTLLVTKGSNQCLIQIDDIQFLSAAGNYVDINARGQRYLVRAKLGDLEGTLPGAEFVRIHRSHIVRVREIERIRVERSGSGTVHLRGGDKLAISKGYRAQLRRHSEAMKARMN